MSSEGSYLPLSSAIGHLLQGDANPPAETLPDCVAGQLPSLPPNTGQLLSDSTGPRKTPKPFHAWT